MLQLLPTRSISTYKSVRLRMAAVVLSRSESKIMKNVFELRLRQYVFELRQYVTIPGGNQLDSYEVEASGPILYGTLEAAMLAASRDRAVEPLSNWTLGQDRITHRATYSRGRFEVRAREIVE